jgi:hypothetical protein
MCTGSVCPSVAKLTLITNKKGIHQSLNYSPGNPPELKIKAQRIEYPSHQLPTIEASIFSTHFK